MVGLQFIIYSATLVLAGASVIAPRPAHCEYNNRTYQVGEQVNKTPCMPCSCSPSGDLVCAIIDCAPPMCVDPQYHKDQCCATCPNGPNCKIGKIIIPANQDYKLDEHTTCRCSRDFSRLFGPEAHQAECKKSITASLFS